MPAPLGPQAVNTSREYDLTLSGPADPDTGVSTSLAGLFDGSESFSAVLSAESGPVALRAAWKPGLAGNPAALDSPVIRLFSPPAPSIAPGDYAIQVIINPGVDDVEAFSGTIRLFAPPAATAVAATWCSLADMIGLMSWATTVEDLGPGLRLGAASNFLSYRDLSTDWLKSQAIARARKALLYQIRIQGPNLALALAASANGYDAGPWFGPSTLPDPILQAELTAIRVALDTPGQVMLDSPEDRGYTRRIAAAYAIHLATRHLPAGPHGDKGATYADISQQFRKEALRMLAGWVCRIDTNGDGIADYELRA